MNVTVDMSDFVKLTALLNQMRPAGRAQLNRVGANAATARVQRHIHGYAMGKHFSAADVGGKPTGHYEKGAAAITSSSSADRAEVVIPIPGISRAFHDIKLTTPTRFGKNYITIPKHAEAYGHTVTELKARGWKIFRPGKKLCLFGYRQKGDKPVMLYALAKDVKQPKDPRLLPSIKDLGKTFATAQKLEINRVLQKAGRK